jgi:hypothetical protein
MGSGSVTVRNGLNGAVWYDVMLSEAAPDTPDATPTGAAEAINGITPGTLSRYAGKVDLSAFVPAGATIDAATLYIARTSAGSESHDLEVYRTAYSGWDESGSNTATWNLTTLDGTPATGTITTGTTSKPITVTDLIADAMANRSGLFAFVIKNAHEDGTNTESTNIRSAQYAVDQTIRPYLIIDYTEAVVDDAGETGEVGGRVARLGRLARVART